MRELIPRLGDRKARDRLDELFSRKTLGAVLFGAAASKVVEKLNIIVVAIIIILVFPVDVSLSKMLLTAFLLLIWWTVEFIVFIYVYVKWEQAIEKIAEASETAKEKASNAKEKASETKEKASEVKEKATRSEPDYELDLGVFGKSVSCSIRFDKDDK